MKPLERTRSLIAGLTGSASDPAEADCFFMSRALDLAWQGAGRTEPNPLVGAVVVRDGVVVGEGYHRRCGESHAETIALDVAGALAVGATLYASLEPCAHHGRTPPCTDRIIESGVRRVVIPALDPDERVFGMGVARLRGHGIHVESGCLEEAAIATNLGYYMRQLGIESSVTLKMAVTLDGRIASAPGRRDNVTGEASIHYAHQLRANHDAVLIGVGTAIADSPSLDCRLHQSERLPVPVVLDSRLRLPVENRWTAERRPFIVIAGPGADAATRSALERKGGRVLMCGSSEDGSVDVGEAVRCLTGYGLRRILVEGGARVFSSFLAAGEWDAILAFVSPKLYGEAGVPMYARREPVEPEMVAVDALRFGNDFLHRYLNRRTYAEIKRRLARTDV
jgi:diaminohydroxyphosphoribosylaminopyrimidine deaminase/5-amino-6-(5-phosphoribosylamino)uracil reductase